MQITVNFKSLPDAAKIKQSLSSVEELCDNVEKILRDNSENIIDKKKN